MDSFDVDIDIQYLSELEDLDNNSSRTFRPKLIKSLKEVKQTEKLQVKAKYQHKILLKKKQNKAILQIINRNNRLGLQEISERLKSQYNIFMKRSTIHQRLIKDLGFQFISLHSPSNSLLSKQNEDIIAKKQQFSDILQYYDLENVYICAIDTFWNSEKREYAWLPRQYAGNYQQMHSLYENQNYCGLSASMIVTFSINGIVSYQLYQGPLSSSTFSEHLMKGIKHINRKQRKVLIISQEICKQICLGSEDINHKEEVKIQNSQSKLETFHQPVKQKYLAILNIMNNLQVQYLIFPPNSPQFDPSHSFFLFAKRKLKAYQILKKKSQSIHPLFKQ